MSVSEPFRENGEALASSHLSEADVEADETGRYSCWCCLPPVGSCCELKSVRCSKGVDEKEAVSRCSHFVCRRDLEPLTFDLL